MFNFRMPNVNLGRSLGQMNPMNMMGRMGNPMHTLQDAFGRASNMSPMTQALGMNQRHPSNEMDMRAMLGQHMQQQQNLQMGDMQQPEMQHPNPLINMSGMNMSQMMGAQPQNQNMPPPNMQPSMGNPNMKGAMPTAPMGTPMPSQPVNGAPAGRGMMGAMNALNAQRPMNSNVDPRMQKMNQIKQMIGRK
jgi:hypothetical protein